MGCCGLIPHIRLRCGNQLCGVCYTTAENPQSFRKEQESAGQCKFKDKVLQCRKDFDGSPPIQEHIHLPLSSEWGPERFPFTLIILLRIESNGFSTILIHSSFFPDTLVLKRRWKVLIIEPVPDHPFNLPKLYSQTGIHHLAKGHRSEQPEFYYAEVTVLQEVVTLAILHSLKCIWMFQRIPPQRLGLVLPSVLHLLFPL